MRYAAASQAGRWVGEWVKSGGITCLVLLSATPCAAADGRFAAFGSLGFGGVSKAEVDFQTGLDSGPDESALDVTLGLGASYDRPLAPFFSLGGLARAYAWSADTYAWETRGGNGGLGFDLAVLPRVHVDVKLVELYLTLPIGFTVASKDENRTYLLVDTQYDLGLGYNWGLFAGVQYPLLPGAAAFFEAGWLLHTIYQRGEAEADAAIDGELEQRMGQFTINLGLAF